MEPAASIIELCGGVAKVAEWLDLNRTSVLRWTHPRNRGGTGGLVPSWHQPELLARAQAEGVDLTPEHFFPRLVTAA